MLRKRRLARATGANNRMNTAWSKLSRHLSEAFFFMGKVGAVDVREGRSFQDCMAGFCRPFKRGRAGSKASAPLGCEFLFGHRRERRQAALSWRGKRNFKS